jgi:very-short-patch-repair endonuclease
VSIERPKGAQGGRAPSAVLLSERSLFRTQLGLATRVQLLGQGVTHGEIRGAIAQGRWRLVARGLYEVVAWPELDGRRLLAACLVTEGVASHASAAWVWGLLDREPKPISVSVVYGRRPIRRITSSRKPGRLLPGWPAVVVNHSSDLSEESTTVWRGIPTTNPLRSLVDLAGDAQPDLLDAAIDAALARKLVTVEGLTAEASRLKSRGRRGPGQLMAGLERRVLVGAPSPSVLESRALRLLKRGGVSVEQCETVVDGGRYRLDIQVGPHLFVELDGYAYHWSPEQKRYDEARRNRLRLLGNEILVYDWGTVMNDGRRLVSEVKSALSAARKREPGGRAAHPSAAPRTGPA